MPKPGDAAVFFWYVGPSIVGVYEIFRSRGLDYRLIALGALAPLLVDLPSGHMGPGHSIVVAVGVLVLVMVGTIGRPRLVRRRLVCLPIGWFCGLILSGAFLHDTVFLWPLLGDPGDVGLFPPLTLFVLGEAAGFAVCAWSVGRFGLNRPDRRDAFVRDGKLAEIG
jgi:hypothetical protein